MRQLLLRFGATGEKKLVWIEIHFPGPQVVITNIPHPRISSGGWRQQTVRNQDENCFVPAESKVKSVDGIFSLVSWCRPSGTWKRDFAHTPHNQTVWILFIQVVKYLPCHLSLVSAGWIWVVLLTAAKIAVRGMSFVLVMTRCTPLTSFDWKLL